MRSRRCRSTHDSGPGLRAFPLKYCIESLQWPAAAWNLAAQRRCRPIAGGGLPDTSTIIQRYSVVACAKTLAVFFVIGVYYATCAAAATQGHGLGVRREAGRSRVPGSVGDYFWSGASGPCLRVDPQEKVTAVMPMQCLTFSCAHIIVRCCVTCFTSPCNSEFHLFIQSVVRLVTPLTGAVEVGRLSK